MEDYFDTFESCPACLGIGETPEGDACPFCDGTGNGLNVDLEENDGD